MHGQVDSLFHDLLRPCGHATLRITNEQQHWSHIFLAMSPSISLAGDFVAAVRVAVLVLEPVLVPVLVISLLFAVVAAVFVLLYLL